MNGKSEFAISREFVFAHENFQIYSKQRIRTMQRLYEESKPAVHKVLFADDLMVNAKSWRELLLILFVCLFLLLYVPCQQLWSLRDGQFT